MKILREYKAINEYEMSEEEYIKYYKVWESCNEAGIDCPSEVLEALKIEEGCTPLEKSLELSKDFILEAFSLSELLSERENISYGEITINTEGIIIGLDSITLKLNK